MEQAKAGEVRYKAASLEDIATAFDKLAGLAAQEKRSEQTKIMQSYRAGEAAAFVIAAEMLRKTTLEAA